MGNTDVEHEAGQVHVLYAISVDEVDQSLLQRYIATVVF